MTSVEVRTATASLLGNFAQGKPPSIPSIWLFPEVGKHGAKRRRSNGTKITARTRESSRWVPDLVLDFLIRRRQLNFFLEDIALAI